MMDYKLKLKELVEKVKTDKKKYIIIAAITILVIAAFLLTTNIDKGGDEILVESDESIENTEENLVSDNGEITEESPALIYVDISGEVKEEGVYEMENGDRIFQLIEKAGGLTKKANLDDINQAEILVDGQKIVIPSLENKESKEESSSGGSESSQSNSNGLVNINKADSTELQSIPGIGPSKAQKIVDYRNQNGNFGKIEDLTKVSGIGDKTLENMRPYICI
ncbi:MAG: helix-hairpin-helix domain-containing protein [Clostridia bacterium]|nr:helix-hairpin-helix domain-containing protein [Clostridia bacterium]